MGRKLFIRVTPPITHIFLSKRLLNFRNAASICLAWLVPCVQNFIAEEMLLHVSLHTFLAELPAVPLCSGFSSNFKDLFYVNVVMATED